jgi:hypothetical protein
MTWVPERCMFCANGESDITGTPSATCTSTLRRASTKLTSVLKPMTLVCQVSVGQLLF